MIMTKKSMYNIPHPVFGTDYWYYDILYFIEDYVEWVNSLSSSECQVSDYSSMVNSGIGHVVPN